MTRHPVIIGAGVNGLVAAFYLAKAGRSPIVLERSSVIGGGAITGPLHPGFQAPLLTHEVLIAERIVADMQLAKHGLEFIPLDAEVCAVTPEGPPLVLFADVARSVESIRAFSQRDAERYAEWRSVMPRVAGVLAQLFSAPPPDIDAPGARDLWNLLRAGRAFRALGTRDSYRLLRWASMPVADLVDEWFETDLLCATLAARGVSATMLGPWSAGSALVVLMREAHRLLAGGRARKVRGGPGALTRALAEAARSAGAEIRVDAPVQRIVVDDDRVRGVVVGEREIPASVVLSSLDPKTTFLNLLQPGDLMPSFARTIRNYRSAGTLAKINLALSSLPSFAGVGSRTELIAGRVHIGGTVDAIERAFDHAKYGEMSDEPWLDVDIPSILDPQLAPPGAHVASIYAHYAPYALRGRDWGEASGDLLTRVLAVLERHAPGIGASVVAAQVVTPADLEQQHGYAGGHVFHGELAADQLFAMRPVLGYGRYATPVAGLFLCGGGTHPGGFLTGTSGRLAAERVQKSD